MSRTRTAGVKQCSVLYVSSGANGKTHVDALQELGLDVHRRRGWPEADDLLLSYEAVVIEVQMADAAGIAMRIRVKPRFGQRVLIALVCGNPPDNARRAAMASGFDDVLDESAHPRMLAARIFRALRHRPEFRCRIPRRPAA